MQLHVHEVEIHVEESQVTPYANIMGKINTWHPNIFLRRNITYGVKHSIIIWFGGLKVNHPLSSANLKDLLTWSKLSVYHYTGKVKTMCSMSNNSTQPW